MIGLVYITGLLAVCTAAVMHDNKRRDTRREADVTVRWRLKPFKYGVIPADWDRIMKETVIVGKAKRK